MTHEPAKDAVAHSQTDTGWFQQHVPLLIGLLVVACLASLVAELYCRFYQPFFDEHHPAHFEIENLFGYQAVIGFAAFICVVFLGKLLRLVVQRPEDYYDQ